VKYNINDSTIGSKYFFNVIYLNVPVLNVGSNRKDKLIKYAFANVQSAKIKHHYLTVLT
jgi:hypothetical protein